MSDPIPANSSVVLHAVDSGEQVERAAATARLLRETFPELRIVIVVNGEALEALPSFDTAALPDGARISACALGVGRRNIDPASLPEGVELVPTAPEAIVREQLAGAAYIRL